MRLVVLTVTQSERQWVLAAHGFAAETWREAGRGLLGRRPLAPEEALVIPTRGVHMLGMQYALDLLYVDKAHRIVRIVREIAPNRLGPFVVRARWVVELPAGAANRADLALGQEVTWKSRSDGPAFS